MSGSESSAHALNVVNLGIVLASFTVQVTTLMLPGGPLSNPITEEIVQRWSSGPSLIAAPVLLVVGVVLSRLKAPKTLHSVIALALAALSYTILLGSALIERPLAGSGGLWDGFGPAPSLAIAALSITLLVRPVSMSRYLNSPQFLRLLMPLCLSLLILPRLLLFVQPQNGLINLGDTTYHVLDELLAPMSGMIPYHDYSPQYSGMLGWLTLPIGALPVGGDQKMTVLMFVCNLFGVAVPIVVLMISRLIMPKLPPFIAFVAFVALWTVCGTDLGYSTQIREFSTFARFLPPLIAIWLIILAITKSHERDSCSHQYLAGFALGFSALNSADSGLPLMIAAITSLLIFGTRGLLKWTIAARVSFASMMTFALYFLTLLLVGRPASLQSYFGLRTSGLAGDLYSAPRYGDSNNLHAFGPHIFILLVPVLLVAFALSSGFRHRNDDSNEGYDFIAFTIGLWSLSLVVKFLSFPTAVAVPNYVVPTFLGVLLVAKHVSTGLTALSRSSKLLPVLSLPFLFLISLPIGAVYPTSNVHIQDELKRISGHYVNRNDWSITPARPVDGWTRSALAKEDNFLVRVPALALKYERLGSSIGYFGVFGNTLELLTGIKNVLGIPAPESLRFGGSQPELACRPVQLGKPDIVLVYASEFPCSGYALLATSADRRFRIFERLPSSL